MKTLLLVSAAAGLSVTLASAAIADENQFLGQWHWNKAKSTLAAGEPAPRDASATIESANGGAIRWSAVIVDDDGQTRTQRFDGKPDGTPYPVQGADNVTAAFTWTNGDLHSVFKSRDGGSDMQSCHVEADNRTMICKGTWTDGSTTENYVDVYDRV